MTKSEHVYKLYHPNVIEYEHGYLEKQECEVKGCRGIFKTQFIYKGLDNVMEAVCYNLAQLLGVRCCKDFVMMHNNKLGSFSAYDDEYNVDTFFTVTKLTGLVEPSIDTLFGYILNINNRQLAIEVYKMLVFDYIMGQLDRHMENMAFIVDKGSYKLYPAFDNGLCCFTPTSIDLNAIEQLKNGFYENRIGSDEEILRALYRYRPAIWNSDLRQIIRYNNLSYNSINNIITQCDKYNQFRAARKNETIQFILRNAQKIHLMNIGK